VSRPRSLLADMRRVQPDWRLSLRASTAKRVRRWAAALNRLANRIDPLRITIEL
jgi:hypothetical protein